MPDTQREHWQATFDATPDLYGTGPSEPGAYAVGLLAPGQIHDLLELGAGQGRDTLRSAASSRTFSRRAC